MISDRTFYLIAALLLALMGAVAFASPAQRNVETEENNRKIVVEFYNKVFNEHDVKGGADVIVENYIQHNPNVPDGKKPFVDYFTGFFKENPNAKAQIVKSSASDDLVWLHVHSTNGSATQGRAIVDIFRVKDGKIVEHWDVIQNVPEKAANNNTMF